MWIIILIEIMPLILFLIYYIYCLLQFSKISRGIFHNYISLITLNTDWKNTFLEDLAESTRSYFHTPFISITKLKSSNTGRMIISSGESSMGYLVDSIEKEEYFLNKKTNPFLPFVYKSEDGLIQKNTNILKSYNLDYSFMIPIFFSDGKEEVLMSLYFKNGFLSFVAYLKYILIRKKFSYFYAGVFRNFMKSFESTADLLLEEIEDHVAISLDENSKIVAWNKGAEKLFAYRSIEIIGQDFSVLFNYGEEDVFAKSLEILEVKNNIKYFATLKDRMNIPIKVELKVKKMASIASELAGYSVFVKDITKEEIFKDNIQQHSFINYTILENSQDGILILDAADKIIFYNQRVRIILDNAMNLFGIPGKKIFPRNFGEVFEKTIDRLKEEKLEFLDIDYSFESRYYNIRFFRVHKNSNNEYGGVIVFFIDESMRMFALMELEEKKEALENINKNLLDALDSAKIMQETLVPDKLPDKEKMDCEAIYKLSDDLGGDFYYVGTVFVEEKEYIISFISDVSGHGISSSMLNVMVRDVYQSYVDVIEAGAPIDPANFLKMLNKKLLDINVTENKFITCIVLITNLTDREISISSAGHTLPYFIRNNKVELMSFKRTVPLGVMDVLKCHTEVMKYEEGDRFVLYTDGFLDLFEVDDQKPSDSAKYFLQEHINESLIEQKEKILQRHEIYKQEQLAGADDLTMLFMELK